MRTVLPLAGSHNRTVFPLPEARTLPCGDQDMEFTGVSFPVKTRKLLPLVGSHRRMFSRLPEANTFPSGEKATDVMGRPCTNRIVPSRASAPFGSGSP